MHKLHHTLRSPDRFEHIRKTSNRVIGVIFLVAVASLTADYGFHIGENVRALLHITDIVLFACFIAIQGLKLLAAPNRKTWLRERNIEYFFTALLLLMAVLLPLADLISGKDLSAAWQTGLASRTIIVIQIVLVAEMLFSTVRFGRRFTGWRIHPARIFIGSFALVILLGTLALLLPKASTNGVGVVDAFFTSTSAVCVTGLIVVDTATHFTTLGKVIILTLIQIGGLGLMTFTTFFTLFSGRLSIRERVMLQDMLSREHLGEVRRTVLSIIGVTFLIEAIGAVFLFFSWPAGTFDSMQSRIFSSVFHSVSAFCNAGFSLFSDGLAHPGVAMNPALNISIASLIVLGGLGFLTIVNVASLRPWAGAKNRKQHRLTVHSRLVLASAGILIAGGAFLLFIGEGNSAFRGLTTGERIMAALFQSITARTAGFNTVDIASLALPGTLLIMLLMFIGASPASTGGGIKTTTASVLFLNAMNHVRGKKSIEIAARTIPHSVIDRAQAALLFGLLLVFTSVLLLSWLESFPLVDLLFEAVSAMGTVGLSRGITGDLSAGSKIVLIFTMLIGRVGALTFMQAVITAAPLNRYDYPTESVIVG